MRRARRDSIGVTGIIHKMWRGHNREPVLESNVEKCAYLNHLTDTFTDQIRHKVQWHAYCLMGNHTHEVNRVVNIGSHTGLKAGIRTLGNWMRNAHSRFGAHYNRMHHRQGKVAYDRPKTTEIEHEPGVLRVMFYTDANPVRAGMVSHPNRYPHSTHRFYAHGESNAHTAQLTPPPAYLALGKTPKRRQRRYRQLCDQYLREQGLIDDTPQTDEPGPALTATTDRGDKPGLTRARGDPG